MSKVTASKPTQSEPMKVEDLPDGNYSVRESIIMVKKDGKLLLGKRYSMTAHPEIYVDMMSVNLSSGRIITP